MIEQVKNLSFEAFPTCVGMNRDIGPIVFLIFRVPYMCGDEPPVLDAVRYPGLRSLHVWG